MSDVDLSTHERPEPRRAIEAWAEDKGTEAHWFAAAKYHARWGAGREVTESVYDSAVHFVQNITLR
jgi:hypothetical protein